MAFVIETQVRYLATFPMAQPALRRASVCLVVREREGICSPGFEFSCIEL